MLTARTSNQEPDLVTGCCEYQHRASSSPSWKKSAVRLPTRRRRAPRTSSDLAEMDTLGSRNWALRSFQEDASGWLPFDTGGRIGPLRLV